MNAFLAACRQEPATPTPVWLMRQAGRYLPEYRAIRERHSMSEMLGSPELAVEVTLQPLKRFPLDAAIIFMDILPPLAGMGLTVTFDAGSGEGPGVSNPLRSTRDIDLLAVPPAAESLGVHLEAIRLARAELAPRGVPLIGFCGAPFTLASYAVEGTGSRTFARTKALMYNEPAAWRRLMSRLVTVLSDFLLAQAKAGAAALQVFDSWAGLALGRDDYVRYVQPYNRQLFSAVKAAGVPVINFSTGTAPYIEEVAGCGGEVVGVDWRMPIESYRSRIRPEQAIQGNLDPVALFAPWRELRPRIDAILASAGGRGHLFNLGHGILPDTPMDSVARLVDHVHQWKGTPA
ncbi:MAG TPA: uroporphyrinogen decarboxylase [Spirochaetia bacterium]|nr:uroporphyrinogen decarboxylase [Spirochaetia bacterium]